MAREGEIQGRLQIKKAAHKEKTQARAAAIETIQHSYARIKDEPAFVDILAKAKSFAAYHTKMAKDAVGYRDTGEVYENGKPVQEVVYYDQDKRVSELDKAAGIEELEDYILRQLTESAKLQVEEEVEAKAETEEDTPAEPVA